jgi:uridine phosphorylase
VTPNNSLRRSATGCKVNSSLASPSVIINLEELELGGKKVLIRQDLNVPIKAGVVTSDKR